MQHTLFEVFVELGRVISYMDVNEQGPDIR